LRLLNETASQPDQTGDSIGPLVFPRRQARKNKFKALMIGGTENHGHVLLSLPADMALAKAMQWIKGASSRWMNETHTKDFAWQEGYGAFTVGISQMAATIAYIQSQAEHHRKRSFEEEFIAFLKKHDVEYDPATCGVRTAARVQASLRDAMRFPARPRR
jgi:putative transposase